MSELEHLKAEDLMKAPVITVGVGSRLDDAARTLRQCGISGALVVGPDGEGVGVVSMSDILSYLSGLEAPEDRPGGYSRYFAPRADETWDEEWEEVADNPLRDASVGTVMSPRVFSLSARATIPEIARELTNRGIHRIFVEKAGRIAGVVSTMDVMASLASLNQAKAGI